MTALLLAALLAAPAPSRDQILRERHRAIDNAREKATAAALRADLTREQVYSRPIGPPGALGAQETVQVPIVSTKVMLSDGRILELSGVLTGTITTPAPPPPPVVTKLTGIRDAAGALVTGGTSGQRLVLEGERLAAGDLIRVAIGGQIAPVSRQSAGMVEFTVPSLPAGPSTLELWWLVNNNWQSKGRLPFTVRTPGPEPQPQPIPPPGEQEVIRIERYEDGSGNPVTSIKVNQPLVIVGSGFGTRPGRVWVNLWVVPVLEWTPTRIRTMTSPTANDSLPVQIDIERPDGRHEGPTLGPRVVP